MDTAYAWEFMTDRLIAITVNIDSDQHLAVLSMPEARTLLNTLTEAIAKVDNRDELASGRQRVLRDV